MPRRVLGMPHAQLGSGGARHDTSQLDGILPVGGPSRTPPARTLDRPAQYRREVQRLNSEASKSMPSRLDANSAKQAAP